MTHAGVGQELVILHQTGDYLRGQLSPPVCHHLISVSMSLGSRGTSADVTDSQMIIRDMKQMKHPSLLIQIQLNLSLTETKNAEINPRFRGNMKGRDYSILFNISPEALEPGGQRTCRSSGPRGGSS